jgi:polyhydroxyalkanoate synthase
MTIDDVPLDLSKVTQPIYLQSAKEDHIAPANSVFKATKLFGGPVRFIMAGSGHIAGVINPPAAKKYQYWTNDTPVETIQDWRQGSVEHPGSWWPDWDQWLAPLSGEKIPARVPGDGGLKILGDAPGEYVRTKAQ